MAKSGISVTLDKVAAIEEALRGLAKTKVLIGIPSEKALRTDGPINNAQLGYIHEFGAPEVNIPPRPFLYPTVRAEQGKQIIPSLKNAAVAAFEGRIEAVDRIFSILGQRISDAVRNRIIGFIPPPLKPDTILSRTRRLGAYKAASRDKRASMRAAALDAGATPLIDTGALLKSITWILKKG